MRSRSASPKSRFFPDTRNGISVLRKRLEVIDLAQMSQGQNSLFP
jgi:hypothetical protein